MPGHPVARLVARLRRVEHSDVDSVAADRPQRKLARQQHRSRDVWPELSGVLQQGALVR